ncbi:unnamed protein product, partial [Didymodactylos carnosus]
MLSGRIRDPHFDSQ